MQDIFEVVTLYWLLGIKQVKEFLHKLGRHIEFELFYFNGLVDHELQEELIDALQVRPGWVHLLLLVDTSLCKVQIALLYAR